MDSQNIQKKPSALNLVVIILIVFIGSFVFYWLSLKPQFDKKSCYNLANNEKQTALNADNNAITGGQTITRADYDKIFNDQYDNCLKSKGY